MTRERDIGRVLEAWLAPGPTDAPHRILDRLADRIEHVPQRRFPRATERLSTMTLPAIKLAAAAAIALAIGIGLQPLLDRSPQVAASPSPSASAVPAPGLVPEALRYRWFSRSGIDGDPGPGHRFLIFDDDSIQIVSEGLRAGNRVAATGPDRLTVTQFGDSTVCATALAGSYTWSLSPGGIRLSLRSDDDACALRADHVAGDFLRIDCRNPDDPCLGVVEAGTYESNEFSPGAFPGGFVRYTVPEGWANASDGPATYNLVRANDYDSGAADAGVGPSIEVFSRPAAAHQDPSCPFLEQPGVGTSMADLVGWTTGHPALVVERQEPIVIGDLDGVALDLALAPDWTRGCPNLGVPEPAAVVFTEAGPRDDYLWGIETGTDGLPGRARLILLDLGQGHVITVWIHTPTASQLDAFVEEAMPIVESLRFTL